MKVLVIYHKADFDGIFCREIVRKALGDTAEYLGWDYGDPIPAVEPGREVVMVDISVDGLMTHPRLTWIDHHKSAIAKFSQAIPGERIDGVAACRLAWQYYFGPTPLPTKQDYIDRKVVEPYAVQLAGEYDIWDKRNPEAELFQHGLRSQPLTDDIWAALLSVKAAPILSTLLQQARCLAYSSAEANASLMRDVAFDLNWEGLRFLAINKPHGNSRTFAAGVKPEHDALLTFYWLRNKWRVSLYHAPHRTDLDLSQIAVKYGGGGHRGACGFEGKTLPFQLAAEDNMSTTDQLTPASGLHQKYTGIVREALLRIGDDAISAQHAISLEEFAALDPMEVAQLLCDCERALRNTRIATKRIADALRPRKVRP